MRGVVCLGALVAACASQQADDSFHRKVAAGCVSEDECRALVVEAGARVRECDSDAGCKRAQSDLASAGFALNQVLRDKQNAETSVRAQQQHDISQQHARERMELTRREEVLKEQEAARADQERERRRAEAERTEQEERDREARYLSLLGAEGRRKKLLACYAEYAPIGCTDAVGKLLAAAADPGERSALIKLNEKTMQQEFDRALKPPPGDILCCDQTISESCVCGGKLAGCCSNHGGVCGCVEPRQLRAEEKSSGPAK